MIIMINWWGVAGGEKIIEDCQKFLDTQTLDEGMSNEVKKMDKFARDLLTNPTSGARSTKGKP
jgi:hypothetical protein